MRQYRRLCSKVYHARIRSWPECITRVANSLECSGGKYAKTFGIMAHVLWPCRGRPDWRDRYTNAGPACAGCTDRSTRDGGAARPVRAVADGIQDLGQMG